MYFQCFVIYVLRGWYTFDRKVFLVFHRCLSVHRGSLSMGFSFQGSLSMGSLSRGVSVQGGTLSGEELCLAEGVSAQGVFVQGGLCAGGVSVRGTPSCTVKSGWYAYY